MRDNEYNDRKTQFGGREYKLRGKEEKKKRDIDNHRKFRLILVGRGTTCRCSAVIFTRIKRPFLRRTSKVGISISESKELRRMEKPED